MKEVKTSNKQLAKKTVTIIVVTYNNEKTIHSCLTSVFANNSTAFHKRIVLVDNNSQDSTPAILKELETDQQVTRVVLNNFNDGFARTINTVIAQEKTCTPTPHFFFLLNPDATLKSNALENLLQTASHNPKIGLLSCKIIDPNTKKIWFKNGSIDFLRFKAKHSCPTALQTPYATGCALLINSTLLEEIGLFDPYFFLYYEDADLSCRAIKAGYRIATEDSAICYHQESHSASLSVKNYFLTRNALYFFCKHYPKPALPCFWAVFYLRFFYHKLFSQKPVVLRAMQDFWKN